MLKPQILRSESVEFCYLPGRGDIKILEDNRADNEIRLTKAARQT